MRKDRQISSRLKEMLSHDKLSYQQGFYTAFCADISHVLYDYFEIEGKPNVKIELQDDGSFEVSICAKAVRIKQFETTQRFL